MVACAGCDCCRFLGQFCLHLGGQWLWSPSQNQLLLERPCAVLWLQPRWLTYHQWRLRPPGYSAGPSGTAKHGAGTPYQTSEIRFNRWWVERRGVWQLGQDLVLLEPSAAQTCGHGAAAGKGLCYGCEVSTDGGGGCRPASAHLQTRWRSEDGTGAHRIHVQRPKDANEIHLLLPWQERLCARRHLRQVLRQEFWGPKPNFHLQVPSDSKLRQCCELLGFSSQDDQHVSLRG